MPTTDRDFLVEAGRIHQKDTLLLATSAHLDALIQLLREASAIIDGSEDVDVRDWRRAVQKVLG